MRVLAGLFVAASSWGGAAGVMFKDCADFDVKQNNTAACAPCEWGLT
jgi:hypothetical protein